MKNIFKKSLIILAFLGLISSLQAAKTHVVKDMAGKEVVLPIKIEKVLTIGGVPAINSFIMALGEGHKIMQGLPSWASMPKWKYEYVFAPQMKTEPIMQGAHNAPDIERILKAKPDVIVTFTPDIAKVLEQRGLKVIIIKWQNASDVKPMMSMLGEVFSKQARAKEYIEYFDKTMQKVAKLRTKIKQKRSALYTQLNTLSVPHLIAKWWIQTAGGVAVSAKAHTQNRLNYSLEQLLGWNPDVIFLQNLSDKPKLLQDARFKSLKAVKNKEVFVVPVGAHVWGNCTAEEPLTVLWALNKLYPKIYSYDELFKDTKYFYDTFYGGVLNDAQIKEILSGDNK